jgi:alpha-tubulin suppressor-like RCC1 family protein
MRTQVRWQLSVFPVTTLLIFTAGALVLACGGDNVAGPPTPVVAAIQVSPGTDTLLTLGRTRQFAAQARDANGNPVNGVTFVWRSSNPGVATVDSVTGIVTAVGNGLSLIRAVASGVTGQASLAVSQVVATVQVTPATASFTAVGDTQRFIALAKDSGGATVQGVRFLWGSSNPAAATVDTLGLATTHASGEATISATGRGVPGYAAVGVSQAAFFVSFVVEPGNTVAGEPITPAVQVQVLDAKGHGVTNNRDPITLDIFDYAGAAGGGYLHGSTTVNAVNGIATFSGLWLTGAGRYVLSATDTALASVTITDTFFVAPAGPDHLAFENQPGAVLGRAVLPSLSVTVRDAFGNRVTGFTGDNINLDFFTNPWAAVDASGDTALGASLNGETVVPPDSGRAVFADLSIDKPAYGYRLRARLPLLPTVTPAVSDAFNVTLQFGPVLAAGDAYTCAVTTTGPYCWGANALDQLGGTTGASGTDSVPQPVSGTLTFSVLSSRSFETCGLDGGSTYCWGATPTAVLGSPPPFVAISSGQLHTCALTAGGDAYCWGANGSGQLGDGTTASRGTPGLVVGGLKFTSIAAGGSFTCGLTVAGAAYCWGANNQGQMGTGTNAPDSVPHTVTGGHTFTQVVAGLFHACALAADSTAYCWGSNSVYQVGDGTGLNTNRTAPTAVAGGVHYTTLAAGAEHTCGIGADAITRCWGANEAGQLGAGFTAIGNPSPVPVTGGQTFTALTGGGHHTCGYTGTTLFCWGSDASGQLGDGRSTDRSAPVRVVQ